MLNQFVIGEKPVCKTWCEFHQPSVSLLGYILDAQVVKMAEKKEEAVSVSS